MASENGCAASSLLSPLFDGDRVNLVEVARTRLSVHYETGVSQLPMASVCLPGAVRLPNALVTQRLPAEGGATVGAGVLSTATGTWRVTRWWGPPRPRGLRPPRASVAGQPLPDESLSRVWGVPQLRPSYDRLLPVELLGAGPGLTPSGDDLLAGALVAAHATADPRLAGWRRALREPFALDRTTAVSRAMLLCALDGYAILELADYVYAVCDDGPASQWRDLDRATANLLAVGHSSGAALMAGVQHTFSTARTQGAA